MTPAKLPALTYVQYRRKQIAELADWMPGFDMTGVSVSDADKAAGSPKDGDKIARNPANNADRWLVAADYFSANFEPVTRQPDAGATQEVVSRIDALYAKATNGNWHVRYCDDNHHQCMTVISSKDYGQLNDSLYNDESDTVAIIFHQLRPAVSHESQDFGDANAKLITAIRNAWPEIKAALSAPAGSRGDLTDTRKE